MSKNNSLVDLGDGTAVSSNSPQSPITLDFDPMSFQFKEDSPLTSPSDNSHELIDDSCSPNSANVDFFDPFCPVKEESPTDYYPNVMLGDLGSHEPLARDDELTKHELCDEPLVDVHVSEACDSASTTVITTTTTTTIVTTKVCRETLESNHSTRLVDSADEDSLGGGEFQCEADESDAAQTQEACVYEAETSVVDEPLIKIDDSQHVTDQDEVFQHDECQFSSNDLSRRGKISSVSSSNSSRSERRTMRKTSSTSSESSMREEEVKSSKILSTVKVTKTEETSTQKKEVTQERKASTEKPPKAEVIMNGVEKTSSSKDDNPSTDPEVNDEHEGRDSPELPVSVAELRSSYVLQVEQEPLSSSPTREVIATGIDIESLRSSYTQHADDDIEIPSSRETISTGVDIESIKSTLIRSEEESHQSSLQEEVKPSIDRERVQRTFSQDTHDDDGNASLGFSSESMGRYEVGINQPDDDTLESQSMGASDESNVSCKNCGKPVYPMEKVKAEKSSYHKTCFRCSECDKSLTIDTYKSHEGILYCRSHYRLLTEPKARFNEEDSAPPAASQLDDPDNDTGKQRRNELIIRENVPAELPPDVVRSDTKPDHGLESLPVNLSNLKSKFEAYREEHHLPSTTDVCTLQRSASVMARLAKYQSAVSGENENGDISDSESEGEELEDSSVVKPTKHKEKVVFSGMSNLKSQWETGSVSTKEERIEEKKEELNKLRQRMCLGRSESMKAVYEKACQDSTKVTPTRTESVVLGRDIKAVRIKERFEKGELVSEVEEEKLERLRKEKEEDLGVFTEPGIANDAKKLFQQIDATVKTTAITPTSPNKSPMNERKKPKDVLYNSQSSVNEADIVKCSEPTAKEEIPVDTTDVSQRFKFFENYSETPKERKRFQITPPREVIKEDTPEKEIAHDPNIVRAVDNVEEIPITDTTRKMLDKFKQLEKETPSPPSGPKPLKRITPPREYTKEEEHDSSPEPERDPNIIRASYKVDDDVIVEADKAKSLRAKFENWDIEQRENRKNEDDLEEECLPQVDTTKTLRAKFEAIKEDTLKPIEKPKPKVNRFIQEQQTGTATELCNICGKKVYPMEKMETSGMRIHKNCFRCAHCGCMLRLENYTTSGGRLYCTPHFKQLFISRGNYDEGFGREQHKDKWNRSSNNTPVPRDLHENGDFVEYTNGDVQCLDERV